MAIPEKDYENERVGGALLMAFMAVERAEKMKEEGDPLAEIEHAIATAEFVIDSSCEVIREEDVSKERKDETLGWMDDCREKLTKLKASSPATH